jgi:hypothetical protein
MFVDPSFVVVIPSMTSSFCSYSSFSSCVNSYLSSYFTSFEIWFVNFVF